VEEPTPPCTVIQNSEFFSTASSRPAIGGRLRRRLGRRAGPFGPAVLPTLTSRNLQ
jgi:hypothetical protein